MNKQVNVTATPAIIATREEVRPAGRIRNAGATQIFVGDPNVTAANGWPLPAGTEIFCGGLQPGQDWWGCTASGTSTAAVIA